MYRNVCAIPEWYNRQLLQIVHEFVEPVSAIQQSDVDHRQFVIPLTATSNSQIHGYPVCHTDTVLILLSLVSIYMNEPGTVINCFLWNVAVLLTIEYNIAI